MRKSQPIKPTKTPTKQVFNGVEMVPDYRSTPKRVGSLTYESLANPQHSVFSAARAHNQPVATHIPAPKPWKNEPITWNLPGFGSFVSGNGSAPTFRGAISRSPFGTFFEDAMRRKDERARLVRDMYAVDG